MKITSANLESVKALVGKANAQVTADTNAAGVAADKLKVSRAEQSAVAGAFDILANAYVSDGDLEDARATALPESVQKAIGYEKPKPPTPAVPVVPSPAK
jgi:hypothetical protein